MQRAFFRDALQAVASSVIHFLLFSFRSVNNFLMTGPKVINTRTNRDLKHSDFGLQVGNDAFPRSQNSQSVSAPGPAEGEGKDHNPFVSVITDDDGNVWWILTPPSPVPGLPDVLQQRGGRRAQRDGGVQVPVRMGALELPRERPAALHTQPAPQR